MTPQSQSKLTTIDTQEDDSTVAVEANDDTQEDEDDTTVAVEANDDAQEDEDDTTVAI